jgi:hypothetical protein
VSIPAVAVYKPLNMFNIHLSFKIPHNLNSFDRIPYN